eukprot:CAMPEP_0184499396 /NCGR_PEP_ID=MMETSP0113_2-20130426/41381_1 /TAXON_ID=91329 /ORGANISM="Norrisiella sphaerica, Strain BC52" /LENGTH=244 /DNA_ID=CAMNT_0026887287 /DNA_START=71 /DNA_END=801 /DNA_ORIENTATION=-
MKQYRLDRLVSHTFGLSRSVARDKILKGFVRLDGKKINKASQMVRTDSKVNLEIVNPLTGERDSESWRLHDYLILNKPKGCITATRSRQHRTVVDVLMESNAYKPRLKPVGRLDLDTTGLLLFTSDGELCHRLLHPQFHIAKTYKVVAEKDITTNMVNALRDGIPLKDPRSGRIRTVRSSKFDQISDNVAHITIKEGLYRQIRRMFASVNNDVVCLERIALGPLKLPDDLTRGQSRELTNQEVA